MFTEIFYDLFIEYFDNNVGGQYVIKLYILRFPRNRNATSYFEVSVYV